MARHAKAKLNRVVNDAARLVRETDLDDRQFVDGILGSVCNRNLGVHLGDLLNENYNIPAWIENATGTYKPPSRIKRKSPGERAGASEPHNGVYRCEGSTQASV
jgi:hypothetical protein